MGTFRIVRNPAARDEAALALRHACVDLMALHGVVGVHMGIARTEVTGVRTKEMEIRPSTTAENALDTVVLVEAIAGEVKSRLGVGGVDAIESEAYRLAYLIAA